MASRGARHLILLSRSGARTEDAETFIHELEAKGARIYAPACDISDKSALEDVIAYCAEKMPPIKGCIQASAVLKVSSPFIHGEKGDISLTDCSERTLHMKK